jgi:hypothetical protein
MSWFCASFPSQEFEMEEAIFYNFMEYMIKLGLPIKEKYFQMYLEDEMKKFVISKSIKISAVEKYSYTDPVAADVAVMIIKDVLLDEFSKISNVEIDIKDFPIIADRFIKDRLSARMVGVFEKAYLTISERENPGEAIEYGVQQIQLLRDVYSEDKLEEISDAVEVLHTSEEGGMVFIVDSGLPAIDNVVEGLCAKQLMGIEAEPGGGKTRMAIGVYLHRAAVIHKRNVIYYALEQTLAEIRAMLIARHVYYLFNKIILDKMITHGTVPADKQALVETASIDLFESNKYGKIKIMETRLYVEDFIPRLKNHDLLYGPFDLFIIDHMYLIESNATGYQRLNEAQIIQRAYRRFKIFVRDYGRAGIAINQFNASGIRASAEDEDIDATMIAGGIEAHRNTDFDIAITATDTMKAQHKRKLHIPKNRSSAMFVPVIVDTRLGCCYFYQMRRKDI